MPTPKGPDGLTLRQRRLVHELPLAPSQAEAGRRAGYSDKSQGAKVIVSQTLTKPNVQKAIAELQEKTTSALVMSLLQRKERLSELAEADPEHPDPVKAIAELNRMERVYGPEQPTTPQPVITYVEVVLVAAPEAEGTRPVGAVAPVVVEARAVPPSRQGRSPHPSLGS